MKTDAAVAKTLLDIGAVTVNPEKPWRGASGMLTPIYTDGRVLISHQPERKLVGAAFEKLCRSNFPDVDVIAGMATSGIPWAAWVAASLNKPMVYIRNRAKRHGKMTRVEGVLEPGSTVVIIDDVVNSGGSLLSGVAAIRAAGGDPVGGLGLLTYQHRTTVEAFRKAKVPLYTLTNLRSLLTLARTSGRITQESEQAVLDWATHPASWTGKE
jgi:orotate phosphoribosyltransferase